MLNSKQRQFKIPPLTFAKFGLDFVGILPVTERPTIHATSGPKLIAERTPADLPGKIIGRNFGSSQSPLHFTALDHENHKKLLQESNANDRGSLQT